MSRSHSQSWTGAAATTVEEQWFLRIDGHNYGPVLRTKLEDFLRPPRLCSVMEVKCGDGVWFTIARHETINKVLEKVGIEVEAARPNSRRSLLSFWPGDFIDGFVAWLLYHWIVTAAVVVYLATNAAFVLSLSDPHVREEELLARYDELWRQAQALAADGSSGEDWRKFADRTRAELKSMLRELEGSASVHQPIRQNLLVAGREHFLKVLIAERPPADDDDDSRLFARRLDLAHEQLSAEKEASRGSE